MSETKQKRMKWKNIWILLLIIFGGLFVLSPLTRDVMVVHFAREIAQENPSVALLPQQLKTTETADIDGGATIERFGYKFQFPFQEAAKHQDLKSITAVHFENGLIALIMDPSGQMDILSINADEHQANLMKQMFTPHELESHYNYEVATMNAKGSDVSLLHSRVRNSRAMMLLTMKSMMVSRKPTAIFRIESPLMKGFQIGDPQVVPTDITLKLYDALDHQLEIHLAGHRQEDVPVITQEQINALVASIHSTN